MYNGPKHSDAPVQLTATWAPIGGFELPSALKGPHSHKLDTSLNVLHLRHRMPFCMFYLYTLAVACFILRETNKRSKDCTIITKDVLPWSNVGKWGGAVAALDSFFPRCPLDLCKNKDAMSVWLNCKAPWLIQKLQLIEPIPNDVAQLVYWVSFLLPLSDEDKYPILICRSLSQKYSLLLKWIQIVKKQWWFDSICNL